MAVIWSNDILSRRGISRYFLALSRNEKYENNWLFMTVTIRIAVVYSDWVSNMETSINARTREIF